MATSKIEWTDKTWNPVTGCSHKSEGCRHCYAEVMARRLKGMGKPKYKNAFSLTLHPEDLDEPKKWKSPSMVFVCSMGDLFHERVPFSFVEQVMATISATPRHIYQILTKRAERMAEYFSTHEVPENAWLGVTVENSDTKFRIEILKSIPAQVHFLSCEPLLSSLGDLDLTGIEWIIVGGESGVSARPMKEQWVIDIQCQAAEQSVPFFFKQWGTWGVDGVKRNKHVNGKLLGGKVCQQLPLDIERRRE